MKIEIKAATVLDYMKKHNVESLLIRVQDELRERILSYIDKTCADIRIEELADAANWVEMKWESNNMKSILISLI